jgi:serine protease Do
MTIAQQLNTATADLLERVSRSLVVVRSGGRGAGAGAIVHPDGLIVTAAHVLGRGQASAILPDGRTLPARLLAYDGSRDIAALSVPDTGLPALSMGDSAALRPGEWVAAIGHPFGVRGLVTGGVVIGVGPGASVGAPPGHSGGPMIDADGRLVGISTIMAGPEVGLAVPVNDVKAFLERALRAERLAAVA